MSTSNWRTDAEYGPDSDQVGPGGQPAQQTSAPVETGNNTNPIAEEVSGEQGMDNPISQFLEDAAVQVKDFVDNTFQGDQQSEEEIRVGRQDQRQQQAEDFQQEITAYEQDDSFAAEAQKAIQGGVGGITEGIANTALLGWDAVAQQFYEEDEKDNVLSSQYDATKFDLGFAENQTKIGNFARKTTTLVGGLLGIGKVGALGKLSNVGTAKAVTKLGKAANLGKRLGAEAVRGAAVDFILDGQENDGGGLADLAVSQFPELDETLISHLTSDTEDNIFQRKLKLMAEGALMGTAFDMLGESLGYAWKAFRGVPVDEIKALPPAKDPGYEIRKAEGEANNATPTKPGMYEPHERAAISDKHTVKDVAESQQMLEDLGSPANGASKPYITEKDLYDVLSNPNPLDGLKGLVDAAKAGVDIKALRAGLEKTNNELLSKAGKVITDYPQLVRGDLSPLQMMAEESSTGVRSPVWFTDEGALVTRVLIKDTVSQLDEIAQGSKELGSMNADFAHQAEMAINRLRTLLRFDAQHSYDASRRLASRKNQRFRQTKDLEAENLKRIADSDTYLDDMLTKIRQGDPEATNEFSTLADAVVMADGDPTKILSFWEQIREVGAKQANSGLYNGMLSGTKTQQRNAFGGVFNAMLRPLATSIGFGVRGQLTEARVALAAYNSLSDSFGESLKVLKTSWQQNRSVHDLAKTPPLSAGLKDQISQLKAQATTTGEKAAVAVVETQYNLMASPWVTLPTRAITATDDAIRTLVARMELKKQAFEHSVESGAGFRMDQARYDKLVDLKIGADGQILDESLLDAARDVTFQKEIQGFGASLQEMQQKYPPLRLVLPFVKTPVNMLSTTASYIPGWTRIPGSDRLPLVGQFAKEYRAAQAAGDLTKIAEYQGREAIGITLMSSASILAANGMITGNGPVDSEKRKLWLRKYQPNSIKTPFGWMSYEPFEPINTILSVAADLTQLAKAGADDAYDRSWHQAAYTIAMGVTQKSYFQGLIASARLLDIQDQGWLRGAQRFGLDTINNAIPYASLRNQLSKAMAGGWQEWTNEFQRLMGKALPGFAEVVGVDKIDILTGKPMDGPGLWSIFTPFEVKALNEDPVVDMIVESGIDIPSNYGDALKGVDLTPQERAKLDEYTAEYGLHAQLKSLQNRKWWQEDYQAWKDAGSPGLDPMPRWYEAVVDEVMDARKYARTKFEREDETFAEKVREAARARHRAQMGIYSKRLNSVDPAGNFFDINTFGAQSPAFQPGGAEGSGPDFSEAVQKQAQVNDILRFGGQSPIAALSPATGTASAVESTVAQQSTLNSAQQAFGL